MIIGGSRVQICRLGGDGGVLNTEGSGRRKEKIDYLEGRGGMILRDV